MNQHRTGWRRHAEIVCVALASLCAGLSVQATGTTESVARRCLVAIAERDLDGQPWAPAAVFEDPTADFFGENPLVEGVHGREPIVALQKSWNLEQIGFDLGQEMFVAEYAVFSGTATITSRTEPQPRSMKFLTVLRVQDDAVTERHDFWNYTEGFGANDEQRAAAQATREVADAYLDAYLEQRFDDARSMMADEIDFQDPTASFFGPGSGEPIRGAAALTERRRKTFANILEFGLEVERSFVTNHHAVYLGRAWYTMPGAAVQSERESVRFEHPAAFVVGVRDGKVMFHRDFVDYSDFARQARAQSKKA